MVSLFRILSKIFMIIYIFLLIYYPPITSVNPIHFLTVIAYIYIVKNMGMAKYLIERMRQGDLIFAFGFMGLYLFCVSSLNLRHWEGMISCFQYALEIIPCCMMIAVWFYNNNYNLDDFMDILLYVGTIQGVLAVVAMVSPEFQGFVVDRAIRYGFDEAKFSSFLERRYYGVAYNLVTYTPLVQVSLLIYALHKTLMGKYHYLLFAPLLLFSAIINARSPLIFVGIGFILFSIMGENKKRNLAVSIVLFAVSCYILYILMMMEIIPYYTLLWFVYGIEEIGLLMDFNSTSVYVDWINNFDNYIPSGVNLLFGTGNLVIGQIDMGYANYLCLGGIIFFLLIHLVFLKLEISNILCVKGGSIRVFFVHVFITTILFNFKMPIFLVNEYSILILLLHFIILGEKIKLKNS